MSTQFIINPTDLSQTTGWYFEPGSSGRDIIASAFNTTQEFLRKELSQHDYESIFTSSASNDPRSSHPQPTPQPAHSIDTFTVALKQARQKYEDKSSSNMVCAKAKAWLTSLSARILYFGNILDVLVQHHPEYASLAWGTFKFLFIAIQNHAELISKISKFASRIADLLPQHKLLLVLYPTSAMREAVAHLFASVLKFVRLAVQFYKDGSLKHSIKAIFQPWSLSFQDLYDDFACQAEKANALAAIAAKAELRDAHIEIVELRCISNQMNNEVVALKSTVKDLKAMLEQKIEAHGGLLTTLYQDVRLDLSQQRQQIGQVHLNQLLSVSFWQRTPTSGESLEYCRSMRRRRHKWSRIVLPEEKKLKLWAEEPISSLLATQSYYPTTQKDFMVDMIKLIRENQFPVIWALRFPDYWEADLTITDILRMLVLQGLQINSSELIKTGFPITLPQIREASTQRDWIALLQQALRGLKHVFIALDMDLLSRINQADRQEAVKLVESLRTGLSTSVKVIASESSFDRGFVNDLQATGHCVRLNMNDRQSARRARLRYIREKGLTIDCLDRFR